MLYYKVLPEADQRPVSIRFKNDFLIGGELFTDAELTRALNAGWIQSHYIREYLTLVNIRPKDTFFFFGSRRQRV